MQAALILVLAFCLGLSAAPGRLAAAAEDYHVTLMAEGLDEPWALAFLPGGGWLITERGGVLRHYRADGSFQRVAGLPEIRVEGQGGLMDVVTARDFARSREIFLSFATPIGKASGTAMISARLSADGSRLEAPKLLFKMQTPSRGGRHFGSRIVEADDGRLFLTLGERGDRPLAQDLRTHNGTVVRLNRDGSLPADNPAWPEGGLPEIWSYGHRNPQAAALDPGGRLWVVEHGARGGDEVNLIEKGANYGWPVIAYGRHYSGGRIGEGSHKAGMQQPAFYWDPSIAPSGMVIHSGRLWPGTRGDFLVGSLKFDMISRLRLQGGALREVERIELPQTRRVRDVREAPDGSIWFLSVDLGAAYRLAPAR